MLMNSQKLCEMNDAQFEELIMLIRYSSLNASKVSNNVAIAFLDCLLSESKADAQLAQDPVNLDDNLLDAYEQDREMDQLPAPKHSTSTVKRQSRISSFRRSMSKIFVYVKGMGPKRDTAHEPKVESYRKSKKEKFHISYQELIVPSSFQYDPMVLNIPLHDFRTRSSFVGMIDVKIHPMDDYPDSQDFQPMPSRNMSNTLFLQKVPWLNPTLSYSKLCRIKLFFMTLPNFVEHVDPSTSAMAWALFERLILGGAVTKSNRKLFSAICFVLAYKFNQDYESEVLNEILSEFNKELNVVSKYVFYNEMKIFTLLEFSLRLNYSHVQLHIDDYLKFYGTSFQNLYDTPEEAFIHMES